MADKKISQLTAASTPLAGTEVLPIVQSGSTVKASIANIQATPVSAGTANAVQFLNTSKVPTTSSDLFWNGTYFNVGGTVISRISTKQQAATSAGGLGLEAYADNSRFFMYSNGTNWTFENSVGSAGSYQPFSFKSSGVERFKIDDTNVTVSTGNLVIGTSGKGIDFSATANSGGTMTSELLADYEEGTWTPNQGAGLIVVGDFSSYGYYTKIGTTVTVYGRLQATTSISFGTVQVMCTNLPFSTKSASEGIGNRVDVNGQSGGQILAYLTTVYSSQTGGASSVWEFTMTYLVD